MTVLHLNHAIRHDRSGDYGNEPAPIAVLHQRVKGFDLSERARERGEQHAFHAVFQGNQVLTGSFPDTLDAVIRAMRWTGHPPLPENQLMASAVTYLGSAGGQRGLWLRLLRRGRRPGPRPHPYPPPAPAAHTLPWNSSTRTR